MKQLLSFATTVPTLTDKRPA